MQSTADAAGADLHPAQRLERMTKQMERAVHDLKFDEALAIREKALGPEHPETATSLFKLGAHHVAQDDLDAARPLVERALAIIKKEPSSSPRRLLRF